MGFGQGATDELKELMAIKKCLQETQFTQESALQFEQTKSGNISTAYVGYARTGSLTTDSVWIISKIITDDDGSGNITTVRTWAITSSTSNDWLLYNKQWALRATYTYS